MGVADDALIRAAADLARASPENWRKFLSAMALRSDQMRELLVSSPIETLQGHQGHAREIAHLLKTLRTVCRWRIN
jgi:hypothetical protein